MAEIRISSNSILKRFHDIPGGASVNNLSEDEVHSSDGCEIQQKKIKIEDKESTVQPLNAFKNVSENESGVTLESSVPGTSRSKESEDNHVVWLPSAIKTEIEEPEERCTGSEDDDIECNEEKEKNMMEQSGSEDEDDSEGGAYHLAEVSYGEDDEKDGEKGKRGEPVTKIEVSPDVYSIAKPDCNNLKPQKIRKKRLPMKSHEENEEPPSSESGTLEAENFMCRICGHLTTSSTLLTEHLNMHAKENVKFCTDCNKIFRHRSNLIQHMITKHTKSAQFKCDVCGLPFAKKFEFLRHQRTHTGERPFACSQCSYRSKNAGCLKDHMRKHTGEKPYACKQCEYRCSYSSMLSRHIAAQHEKKTFVCNVCNYKTNLIRNLTKHLKKHENTPMLVCETCDFTTQCKDKLKQHIIDKHVGGPITYYICPFCKIKYKQRKTLRRHILQIHEKNPHGMEFEEVVLSGKSTSP